MFQRRWAQAVVEQVAGRLKLEFANAGQGARFEVLKAFPMGDPRDLSYDQAAAQLGLTVSAVTSAIHRLRVRFRELFRAEIADIVGSPEQVDEEIRDLLVALSE